MIAAGLFGALAAIGTIVLSGMVLLTRRFCGQVHAGWKPAEGATGRARSTPFVSILKPVCGLDDELEENLLSFTRLRGVSYEVIVSAEEWEDPALEVVRSVMRAQPFAPFRVVVDAGSRHGVVNRKVERLIAAAGVATGDVFLISDSNVRVEPDDVAETIEVFRDSRIGCVSNIFTASGARSFGATIESLHLLSFVAPGAVLADSAGIACVVGKSMAITREVHDAIGGFAQFRRVLAEDQAIGVAVKKAGYEVVLSPVVVRNVIVHRSVKRAVDRQVRWNKIRYSFSQPLYAAELLLNPLALSIVAALLMPARFAFLPMVVVLCRVVQLAILNRALSAGLLWRQLAAAPVLDMLMLYAWYLAFFSNTITWRGYRAKIGRNTVMIEHAA